MEEKIQALQVMWSLNSINWSRRGKSESRKCLKTTMKERRLQGRCDKTMVTMEELLTTPWSVRTGWTAKLEMSIQRARTCESVSVWESDQYSRRSLTREALTVYHAAILRSELMNPRRKLTASPNTLTQQISSSIMLTRIKRRQRFYITQWSIQLLRVFSARELLLALPMDRRAPERHSRWRVCSSLVLETFSP